MKMPRAAFHNTQLSLTSRLRDWSAEPEIFVGLSARAKVIAPTNPAVLPTVLPN
jgi:hypothetical protein